MSLLTGNSLADSGLLEGCCGELQVLHNLRCYVICRGDISREAFDTRKKVDNLSKCHVEAR